MDEIESPADPSLAPGDKEHIQGARNAALAAAIGTIVVVAVIVAAIFFVMSLRAAAGLPS